MSSKHLIQLCVAVVLVLGSAGSALAQQAPWLDPAWGYRSQVSVSNPAGTPLSDFQVRILLDGSFDFTKVKADGSDLRFTDSTGTFVLPMWIESWNPASSMASLWVRVPSIPAAGTTLYLYYGNPVAASVANGSSTFDFFDDFEGQSQMVPGYFELSAPQTTLTLSQGWEGITPPHSLSVLEVNSDGFAYWGWYGTTSCTGIGLARSNDLVSWTKYPGNPLKTNARWPTVQKLGNTYYMLYTADFCTNASYIKLAASTDGINFTDVKTIVQPVPGQRNQNADLFFNPSDNLFYLYWYSGNDASVWNIKVRSASSPAGLDSTASEQTVLTSNQVLAAPHMMLYGGSYYLATEIISNNDWATIVYASTSPVLGFKLLPGNPLLIGGSACMFQHPFGTTLHNFYCKVTNNIWTVEHRTADLTAALPLFPVATSSNWAGSQGTWAIVTGTQQDGTTGKILQGTTSGGHQIMYSAFSGSDYVLEAYGRQVQGRTWGLATRVRDTSDFYSTNLYADLDASQNLWEYGWINSSGSGQAQTLGSAAVGAVDLNAWYKLSVKVHGSTIEVFKDGASQLITSAASLASGGVGLYGENGTIAQFNNVLVHKYAVADPTSVVGPATSPSSQAAVAAVSLNPATVAGGNPSTGTVTLNAAAPAGGASVSLSSSNSAAATVPASVTVPAGATSAEFVVSSLAVSTDTASTVTAAYNGTAAATITVTAPGVSVGVASVTLTPTSVVGGSLSTGTVTLSGPAPTGGVAVALSSSNTSVATVPANVTVNAGSSSATFKVASLPVAAAGTATITASFSGSSAANITVNPPTASSLTLNPASVVGGNASTGTVTLTGPAPAGGSLMSLTSSNTAVASVPANVTVVAGATSANFSITTFAVSSSTSLTITASFGGAQTAALTVTPPPAIAFVQGVSSDHSNSPSTSSAGTFTAANRAGDLIVVGVAVLGSVSSVTDSLGNSYSLAASSTSPAGVTTAVYFAPNIKAGANTLTVRFAASSYNNVDMFEYSGLSPASPVDKTSVASGTSASASSGPVTTSFANELIFAFAQDDGSTFGGGGTGFTVRSHVADNCAEDRVVSIAGSFSASCTWSGTTGWAMVLVTLR